MEDKLLIFAAKALDARDPSGTCRALNSILAIVAEHGEKVEVYNGTAEPLRIAMELLFLQTLDVRELADKLDGDPDLKPYLREFMPVTIGEGYDDILRHRRERYPHVLEQLGNISVGQSPC